MWKRSSASTPSWPSRMQASISSKAALDRRQVVVLPAFGGQRRRGAFQPDAEFEAALNVGDRADRHEPQHRGVGPPLHITAGALPRHDDAVVAQPRQSLAHHRPRRAEALRQFGLRRQPCVDREFAGDDELENTLIDAGAELGLAPGRSASVPQMPLRRVMLRASPSALVGSARQRANSSRASGCRRIQPENAAAFLTFSWTKSSNTVCSKASSRHLIGDAAGITATPSLSPTRMSPG